jgi:hypothetical protein
MGKVNNGVIVVGLLALPPIMLGVGGIVAAIGGKEYLHVAKLLAYGSILAIILVMITTPLLYINRRIGKGQAIAGLLGPSIYTLLPIALLTTAVEERDNIEKGGDDLEILVSKPSNIVERLKEITSPYYVMPPNKTEEFIKAAESIKIGTSYLEAIRIFPPVPNDAPIIVKDLDDSGIMLRYYLHKRFEKKPSHSDRHITLTFGRDQCLKGMEKIL